MLDRENGLFLDERDLPDYLIEELDGSSGKSSAPTVEKNLKTKIPKLMSVLFPIGEGVFDAESPEYDFLKKISSPNWTNPVHIQNILEEWVTWYEEDNTVEIFLDHDEMNQMNQYAFETLNPVL